MREKGILMDLLTRMLEEKWSRGSAHGVWRRGKQTVERETIPSLISDKGKIDIFNPQAPFFCHIHRGTTCLFTYCAIVFALGNTIKKKQEVTNQNHPIVLSTEFSNFPVKYISPCGQHDGLGHISLGKYITLFLSKN